MNCPHCQTPLAEGARFCPACGKAVQSTTPEPNASGPIRQQTDLVGRELVGRFRILSKLGEGGMGAVYRGEQISLKRAVAIKVLRPELSANQQLLRRFSAEAEAVAKLDHPNTVKVYDFGQDTDGSLFIAMELIDGRPLRAVLAEAGPLPATRAFRIALQVAASLVDAHAASIVHRDLKPDNVMLVDKGRQHDIVRVLDFGIAKLRDDSRQTQNAMTQAGDMLGTPQYMAPEQIKGEAIDGRTDVYALGCLLYEMVTARLPFEAPTVMAMLSKHLLELPPAPSQRREDLSISPAIDHVVMAALQKDPNARPPNMEVYAEMLAAVLAQLPADTAPQASPTAASPIAPPVITPQPQVHTPAPAHYPTPPTYAAPPKNRLPIFLVLGALVLGGTAIAIVATKKDSGSTPDDHRAKLDPPKTDDKDDKADDKADEKADDKDDDKDEKPAPPGPDPWATTNDDVAPPHGDAPKPPSVGTSLTPIPRGAHLNPPAGFAKVAIDATAQAYQNQAQGITMILAPLVAGTNDPNKLAQIWMADPQNQPYALSFAGTAENHGHPLVTFTGTANGVPLIEYATLVINSRYRVAYLIVAPAAADQLAIRHLLDHGVTLP